MGWASYQEDNLDARGERNTRRKPKNFTRTPKSPQPIPKPSQSGNSQPPDDSFKSTPVTTTPDRTQQPKPSPKTRQRNRGIKPLKKQDVPVVKTRHVTSDELQRRINQVDSLKTQRVTTAEIQQRIQREISHQEKESIGFIG